jgi:putative ABC transport system substrate-binding protein
MALVVSRRRAALCIASLLASCERAPVQRPTRVAIFAATDDGTTRKLKIDLEREASRSERLQAVEFSIVELKNVGSGSTDEAAIGQMVRASNWDAAIGVGMTISRTVQRHAPSLPLVFSGAGDPVRTCLVDSMLIPGRSATGYTSYLPAEAKMAETLLSAFPDIQNLVVLSDGTEPAADHCASRSLGVDRGHRCNAGVVIPERSKLDPEERMRALTVAAIARVRLHIWIVCGIDGLAASLAATGLKDVGLMIPLSGIAFFKADALVFELATLGWPTIYERHLFLEKGGMVSLAPRNERTGAEHVAEQLDRILQGVPASNLPVQIPIDFEIGLNVAAVRRASLRPRPGFLRQVSRFEGR